MPRLIDKKIEKYLVQLVLSDQNGVVKHGHLLKNRKKLY